MTDFRFVKLLLPPRLCPDLYPESRLLDTGRCVASAMTRHMATMHPVAADRAREIVCPVHHRPAPQEPSQPCHTAQCIAQRRRLCWWNWALGREHHQRLPLGFLEIHCYTALANFTPSLLR